MFSCRATARHCVLTDISYHQVIELEGQEVNILTAMKHLTSPDIGKPFATMQFENTGTRLEALPHTHSHTHKHTHTHTHTHTQTHTHTHTHTHTNKQSQETTTSVFISQRELACYWRWKKLSFQMLFSFLCSVSDFQTKHINQSSNVAISVGLRNFPYKNLLLWCLSLVGLTMASKAYLRGTRHGEVLLYHRDSYPHGAMGPVSYLWQAASPGDGTGESWGKRGEGEVAVPGRNAEERKVKKKEEETMEIEGDKKKEIPGRRLWMWVHPSSWSEVLTELNAVCQDNDGKYLTWI